MTCPNNRQLITIVVCFLMSLTPIYGETVSKSNSTLDAIRNPFAFVKKKIVEKKEPPKPKLITKRKWVKEKPKAKPKKKKKAPSMIVNGIFLGDNSYVLINQDLLVVGDKILGWQVEEIMPMSVELRKGKYKKTLKLK